MSDPTGDLGITRMEAAVLLFGWPALALIALAVVAIIYWVYVSRRK